MALRVWTEAEPTCGSSDGVGRVEQRLGHFGSSANTSSPAARMVPLASACGQRRLVDRAAAADVDEDAVRAERRQAPRH